MCELCRMIEDMNDDEKASAGASSAPFTNRSPLGSPFFRSAMMRISPLGHEGDLNDGQPEAELTEPAINETELSTAGRDVLGYLRMTEAAGGLRQVTAISLRFMMMVVGVPATEHDVLMSWYNYKIATDKGKSQEEALLDLLAARLTRD